jgi:hypothetical protein
MDKRPPSVSAQWWGMKSVFPKERDQVKQFIEALDFEWLESYATSLKVQKCTVRKDIFSSGEDHIIYELGFLDATFWVVRISKPWSLKGPAKMMSEIDTIGTSLYTPQYLSRV